MRISAEAAIEAMKAGNIPDKITPFWQLVDPDSTLARKLDIDANWIAPQRAAETTGGKTPPLAGLYCASIPALAMIFR